MALGPGTQEKSAVPTMEIIHIGVLIPKRETNSDDVIFVFITHQHSLTAFRINSQGLQQEMEISTSSGSILFLPQHVTATLSS